MLSGSLLSEYYYVNHLIRATNKLDKHYCMMRYMVWAKKVCLVCAVKYIRYKYLLYFARVWTRLKCV